MTEIVALAVMSMGTAAGIYTKDLHGETVAIVFVVTWLASAARTLAEVRLGRRQPIRPSPGMVAPYIIALSAGLFPWIVLGALRASHPAWGLWTPQAFPAWISAVGMGLALFSILRLPFQKPGRDDRQGPGAYIPQLTLDSALLAIAIFLTSGSTLVLGAIASWICTLGVLKLRERPRLHAVLESTDPQLRSAY